MWLQGSSLSFFLPPFIYLQKRCSGDIRFLLVRDLHWENQNNHCVFFRSHLKKNPNGGVQIFKSSLQTGIQTSHWTRCHKIWVTMIKFIFVSLFLLDLSWLFLLLFAHSFFPKTKERNLRWWAAARCEKNTVTWSPMTARKVWKRKGMLCEVQGGDWVAVLWGFFYPHL